MAQVPTGGNYVVDNSTGANVRADINEIFDAVLTVNSGGSGPSYAKGYTLWADTSTGTMKIRNGDNTAWIELFQLDGTLTLENGSASTPALAFRTDVDTGIFRSAENKFNVATGGVERMELGTTTIFNEDGADVDFRIESSGSVNMFFVDAGNNRIGIGTTPSHKLHIADATTPELIVEDTTNNVKAVVGADNSVARIGSDTDHPLSLRVNDQEKVQIDTSGNVGIGTSSPTRPLHIVSDEDLTSFTGTTKGAFCISNSDYASGDYSAIDFTYTGSDNPVGRIATKVTGGGSLLSFGTSNNFGNGITNEALIIDSSGRVGIGKQGTQYSGPETNLHIGAFSTDSINSIRIDGTNGSSGGQIHRFVIENQGDSALVNFKTSVANGTETTKMTIKSISGEVGIGTSNPDRNLTVSHGTNPIIAVQNSTQSTEGVFNAPSGGVINLGTTGSYNLTFSTNNSPRMTIDSSGNIGAPSGTNIFNASDSRVKTNVVDLNKGLTAIKSLRPVSFNWIDGFCDEEKDTLYGFIAQEVKAVDNNLIQDFATELKINDNKIENVLRVNEKFIIPMLVKAVQELAAKVAALESA